MKKGKINSMEPSRLNLVYDLFKIVNEYEVEHPDYILAKYFLEHYTQLGQLNIHEVAEECFVSRSSIRRFSQKLGYDNFKDLKEAFKNFDYQYSYFMPIAMNSNFKSWLLTELSQVLHHFEDKKSFSQIQDIAHKIHDSREVIFLSSYSTMMETLEFQRPLILSGKIVKVMSQQNIQPEILNQLSAQDLLIVISSSGIFSEEIYPIVKQNNATKILITASQCGQAEKEYQQIYYLSSKDQGRTKNVYGKYGLMIFFDLLYSIYVQTYGVNLLVQS